MCARKQPRLRVEPFIIARRYSYDLLAHRVVEEVMQSIKTRSPAMARLIFNIRCQQLARQAPAYFGNRGLGR